MTVVPIVYTAPVRVVANVKDRQAQVAHNKQQDGKDISIPDRVATGERVPVTLYKAATGSQQDTLLSKDERVEMSTTERLKTGETGRHILVSNMKERSQGRQDHAYEVQQDPDQTPSMMHRWQMGERPTKVVRKRATGHMDDWIPTPEEREEMSAWERLRTGESALHCINETQPVARLIVPANGKAE